MDIKCEKPAPLRDRHGRVIDYLRISVTDRCNLRCLYCKPMGGEEVQSHDDILRYEEILVLARLFRELGVRKVRVTGGEPLVRRGIVGFVAELKGLGFDEVVLTTNGVFLGRWAEELRSVGLERVNVSLDSLNPETFVRITGRDELGRVMESIDAARRAGFSPIKINCVLMKDINDGEVGDFLRLALEHPYHVRFIQFMPFHNVCEVVDSDMFLGKDRIRELIATDPLFRHFREVNKPHSNNCITFAEAEGSIGAIVPVDGRFCNECNRMRLTADGRLRPCLLSDLEIDVKTPLRSGADRDELLGILRNAILDKPAGYPMGCDSFSETRNMTRIGG